MAIERVLVANRGEIAVRILRTCREMGLCTVAVYSEPDHASRHAELADTAVCIGPGPAALSYLNSDAILTVAQATGCDALHPGYGFLSENPEFARRCAQEGTVFIGPRSEAMALMSDKAAARAVAQQAGVPVVPGLNVKDIEDIDLVEVEARLGFPLLVKAAAGGGGRGMRVVYGAPQLRSSLVEASAEARSAFGDGTLYLEKYLQKVRHIEVQIASDKQGKSIVLGERECSVQRRKQKIIEEAPATALQPAVRSAVWEAARKLAEHVGYENVGTVEFIVDSGGGFYFIEMNTRIQVEHAVTEMVLGVDVVRLQIAIADGALTEAIGDRQVPQGHSIECRVTAEDASQGFAPVPGRIQDFFVPGGPGVRVDTHCRPGYDVPPYYDSLLAKVVVWAPSRQQAICRMRRALQEFEISGITTNRSLLLAILSDPSFRQEHIWTSWLEEEFSHEPAGTEQR